MWPHGQVRVDPSKTRAQLLPLTARLSKEFAIKQLSSDQLLRRTVVLAAAARSGRTLRWAPAQLKADKEVVTAAVGEDGLALQFVAPPLKADKDVVTAAVVQCGLALRYAAAESRGDSEIVKRAVQQNGLSLRFASSELKADAEVVLAAVHRDSRALEFASAELRSDIDIALAAANSGEGVIFASDKAKKVGDEELVLAAAPLEHVVPLSLHEVLLPAWRHSTKLPAA